MTGGGGSAPTPPSPTLSTQAAASAQLAGQMFEAENAPTLGLEDALVRGLISPYESQLASGLAAQSAFQMDPAAYEGRQVALAGANARLAHLYGTAPQNFTPNNLGISLPSQSELPSLAYINALSKAIGGTLSSVHVDKSGNVTPISNTGSTANLNLAVSPSVK